MVSSVEAVSELARDPSNSERNDGTQSKDRHRNGPRPVVTALCADSETADGSSAAVVDTLRACRCPSEQSVDDYFAQLNDAQRPHLEKLRELSIAADPEAREELKWNLPVYVRGDKTNLWMLQNFKNHCSLRFSPPFFSTQKAAVEAAGLESGEGFVKLPYDRELPTELLKSLMQARVKEYEVVGEDR